jgi:hypothetical protein
MKYIKLEVLRDIQAKFSSFGKLLLRDEQMRKDSVTAHTFPGMGPDIDSKVARPWKRLPNIRNFGIELRPLDWLFLLFGLEKRSSPKLTFYSWKNAPANRYIDYMFRRLRKQVKLELFEEATKTIWILMNSSSYKAACFNKIVRNWHRKYELWQVEEWLKEVSELVRNKSTNIDYKRVYLEEPRKASGWRPLGVPTVPWRVYLSMYNSILTEWREVSDLGMQHGYFHGRGVITAWNQLVKYLKTEENIVEIDFKGFFDNITHKGLNMELGKIGLPATEVSFINSLNKSVEKLPHDLKLEESRATLRVQDWKIRDLNQEMGMMSWGKGIVYDMKKLDVKLSKRTVVEDRVDPAVVANQRLLSAIVEGGHLEDLKPVRSLWDKKAGVPQGAPTSPGLATLVLRPLEKIIKAVWYADDGLYFPKSIKRILDMVNMPEYGVVSNDRKFVIVKENGVWKVDSFKFLGIRCITPKQVMTVEDSVTLWIFSCLMDVVLMPCPIFTIISLFITWRDWGLYSPIRYEADTRNGAKLQFTNDKAFLSYLYKAREGLLLDGYFKKSYFMSKPLSEWLSWNLSKFGVIKNKSNLLWNNELTGWLTARMYLDSWSLKVKQDFNLTYKPFSWMGIRWPIYCENNNLEWKKISVFTASSFATNDLMDMIKSPYRYKERGKKMYRTVLTGIKWKEDTKLESRQWMSLLARGFLRKLRRYVVK